MTLAEATRIYQATLEARRALLDQTGHLVSFDEQHETADAELQRARADLETVWLAVLCG